MTVRAGRCTERAIRIDAGSSANWREEWSTSTDKLRAFAPLEGSGRKAGALPEQGDKVAHVVVAGGIGHFGDRSLPVEQQLRRNLQTEAGQILLDRGAHCLPEQTVGVPLAQVNLRRDIAHPDRPVV